MQRLMMKQLVEWKENSNRKPLILKGVRQCGKTYIILEFAKLYYRDYIYFRFDKDHNIKVFFERDLDPHRIIRDLGLFRGKKITTDTLIIFDEIQDCGRAITSLKYFYEDASEYHVISAGSLLGVAIPKGTSFPVGKVDFLNLYPMSFQEFILSKNELLAEELEKSDPTDVIWINHRDSLETMYKEYLIIGGMPEAVQTWNDTADIKQVEKIQESILVGYRQDIGKHAPAKDFPKISSIWDSIPSQLAKENRKFIFSQVKKGLRARDLEDALRWLIDAGLVYKVEHIEKPGYPLSSFANHTFFKLFMVDVGLLRKHADLPARIMIEESDTYSEFKGAMAENYVACELKKTYQTIMDKGLYYWAAEGSAKAEVDFVFQDDDSNIIPVEVKAGTSVRARSITEYRKRFNPEKSILTSLKPMSQRNLSLYGFWKLKDWLEL